MNSQLLYQEDVTILEFEAKVVEQISLPDGRTWRGARPHVLLPHRRRAGARYRQRLAQPGWWMSLRTKHNSRLVHVVEGEVHLGSVQA